MKTQFRAQYGFIHIWILVLIALLLIGGGGYWYYSSQESTQEDTVQTEEAPPASDEDEAEDEDDALDGFSVFSDPATGIEFAYPSAWGEATMSPDDFPHDGESYRFDFSDNSDVFVGIKSPDFAYTGPPRGGFGAVGYGYGSFDNQLTNVQQFNQERLDDSDAYSTVIANESTDHVIYAGHDMSSEGYYVTLLLREGSSEYGAFEFTYFNDTQPDYFSETRNALEVINDRFIGELNSIVSANQAL